MTETAAGSLSIRACRLEDIPSVLELWRQADATPGVTDTADDLRRAVTDSPAHVLVAEVGGHVVGSVIGTFDGWRGNIYRLAVHPDHRCQGVARALVAEVEKRLIRQGAKRITALVEKDHPWAMNFWEAVGYRVDERIVRRVRNSERNRSNRSLCMTSADEPEEKVLEFLDCILQRQSVRDFLDAVVARVQQHLRADHAWVMAWEPVPLDLYGTSLPGGIRSSWVFILRADVATGDERHPNSRQRMMSYRGAGDLQTRLGERWESHRLDSDPLLPLHQRWISVPENVWHQAVTPTADWVVVSFHTVPDEELIEERPAPSRSGSPQQRKYLE